MVKHEYIQANKNWLEAKAKEEGVKAHHLHFSLESFLQCHSWHTLPTGKEPMQKQYFLHICPLSNKCSYHFRYSSSLASIFSILPTYIVW